MAGIKKGIVLAGGAGSRLNLEAVAAATRAISVAVLGVSSTVWVCGAPVDSM